MKIKPNLNIKFQYKGRDGRMVRLYSVICKLCILVYSIVKCKLRNTNESVWAYESKIVIYIR